MAKKEYMFFGGRSEYRWKAPKPSFFLEFQGSEFYHLFVVGFSPNNLKSPIHLLQQYQPYQLVREGHFAEGEF